MSSERQFRVIMGDGPPETWEPLLVLDDRDMGAVVFMAKRQKSIYIETGSHADDYERCHDMPALSTSPQTMSQPRSYEAARRLALLHLARDHDGTEWALPDFPLKTVSQYTWPRKAESWQAMAEHCGVLADWYDDQGEEIYAAALRFLARPLQQQPPRVDVLSYTKEQFSYAKEQLDG